MEFGLCDERKMAFYVLTYSLSCPLIHSFIVKMQLREWETMFADRTSRKRIMFKIKKELIQPSTKRTNNLIRKWANDLNRK